MPAKPLRAVVYVRLSSHRGTLDPSTSPQRQRASCEAYSAAKGWDVVDVVEDLDVSGSDKGLRLDRPGLVKIRALLRAGKADVVIFAKLDRLARNVIDFRTFAEEVEQLGGAIVSVAESLDLTTPSGRFVATILAAFAEMEAAAIAARISDSRVTLGLERRFPGGPVPYGYRTTPHPSGKGRALELEPDEAAVVRRMVDHLLEGGGSLYQLVQDLNDAGIRPRKAARWSTTTVRNIVTGSAIRGHLLRKGETVRDADGMPARVWPAIVNDAEAAALAARLPQGTGRGNGERRAYKHLLSGVLRCSGCGRGLRTNHTTRGVRVYYCGRYVNSDRCPKPVTINAEEAEAHVVDLFLGAVGAFPVTRFEVVGNRNATALANVDTELRVTAAAMTEPEADVAALVERLHALRAHRDELSAQPAEPELRRVETGRTFAQEWEAAADDVAYRRELLSGVFRGVEVAPASSAGACTTDRLRLLERNP